MTAHTAGPKPKRERAPLVIRQAWMLAASFVIIGVLVLTVIALLLSSKAAGQAKAAAGQAKRTSDCVNNILATRSGVTDKDTQAHIRFSHAITHALPLFGSNPRQGYADLVIAANRYAHTLAVDQRFRQRHPLGTCS